MGQLELAGLHIASKQEAETLPGNPCPAGQGCAEFPKYPKYIYPPVENSYLSSAQSEVQEDRFLYSD